MTKLSDTQAVVLSAASRRSGNQILPLPERLRGGAAQKVVAGLLARGLAAEIAAGRDDPVWREADGRAVALIATEAALAALGIEPGSGGEAGAGKHGATAAETGAEGGDGPKVRAGTKQAELIAMLREPGGASIAEIVAATGWQAHTVRGAIAGALKKRLGLPIVSDKVAGRGRVYRIA